MHTLGERIAYYRKAADMTQAELAEACSVTAQAVSKWENDLTAPDISLLPKLAALFHITTDELLGVQQQTATAVDPEKVDMSRMSLRLRVLSADGDNVNVSLSLSLAERFLGSDGHGTVTLFSTDKGGDLFRNLDWQQVFALVKQGATGKLFEAESADGDRVEA